MNHSEYFRTLDSDPEYQKAKEVLKLHFALGDAVLRARIMRNWTQSELAKHIGTKQANISRIESGLANPTIKLIQKIIQVLDLEISFTPVLTSFSYNAVPVIKMAVPSPYWSFSQQGSVSESYKNVEGLLQ